jgi:hypothetical protein
MMITIFAARIDDGDEMDDWTTTDYRTGNSCQFLTDRLFQDNPESSPMLNTSGFAGILINICAGIPINIWNRAKFCCFLTHSLAGGGSHNLGYGALKWEIILQ